MTSTIGRFTFHCLSPKKTDEPLRPFNAIVHIVPKTLSRDADGRLLLSPDLMTEEEIEGYIDEMKKDLDRVGKLAKEALSCANAKTRAILHEE